LFLVLPCLPSLLIAQDAKDESIPIDTAAIPRTSMFPEKTAAINQSFERFFNSHNTKTATYLGFIPGLGQVYNHKYWKLPIVYAGFGVIGYFALSNRNEYKKFADAYHCKLAEDPDEPETKCDNPLAQKYTADNLKANRDYYRRNMELSFVIMGVWYILQILDATVDAHLYYWEVDEDLSVRVQPVFNPPMLIPAQSSALPNQPPSVYGVSVSLNF
jgi:hypothetical protein